VFRKQKEIINLGGNGESVVFIHILANLIPGTTFSDYTRTFPQGMYKISGFRVSQFTTVSRLYWSVNTLKCTLIFKTRRLGSRIAH
jgi:hypothetical protein